MTETPLALVTGGGAGIGAAICRRLALATGGPRHEVIVVDRDDRRAEETARSILADGGKALAVGKALAAPLSEPSRYRSCRGVLLASVLHAASLG